MVSPDFNVTYAVLMMRSLSPIGDPPELPPDRRLGIHFTVEEPIKLVERVLADSRLNNALPDSPEDRADALVKMLDAMVAGTDVLDEDARISATLSDALTGEFKAKVREAWDRGRLLRRAFGHASSVRLEDGVPPSSARHAVSAWEPKGLFLEGELRVHGHDHTAREFATALGREERRKWHWTSWAPTHRRRHERTTLPRGLRRVLAEMRASGLDPQLILMPPEWRLLAEFGVDAAPGWGGTSESPTWVPEDSRNRYRGSIDGVPVFALVAVEGRVGVCDLDAFGKWLEWAKERELKSLFRASAPTRPDAEQPKAGVETPPRSDVSNFPSW